MALGNRGQFSLLIGHCLTVRRGADVDGDSPGLTRRHDGLPQLHRRSAPYPGPVRKSVLSVHSSRGGGDVSAKAQHPAARTGLVSRSQPMELASPPSFPGGAGSRIGMTELHSSRAETLGTSLLLRHHVSQGERLAATFRRYSQHATLGGARKKRPSRFE